MNQLAQFSPFITQVLLPISLAFIMLGIGLSVKISDFAKLENQKTAVWTGFLLQIIGLPLIAFLLIMMFGIQGEYALAFLIIAACPGGATSNALTFIFSGIVTLSVVLTLLSSVITPFSVPFLTQLGLGYFMDERIVHEFSLTSTIAKLFVLSIVPLLIGQTLQRFFPIWCERNAERAKKLSGWWFLGLIFAMIITNFDLLQKVVREMGWFIFMLSIASLMLGYWGARLLSLSYAHRLTLAIEVGVQNAGVGIVIASSILHSQPITMLMIAYGILMQIPIVVFSLWYCRRKLVS